VLVSSQPRRLAATILSRCLPVTLPLPERATALAWLATQGRADAGGLLTQAAGRPLHALEISDPERTSARQQFLEQLAAPRFDPHTVADKAARESLAQWVEWLQTWCHDLLLLRAGGAARFHPDQAAVLARLAASAHPGRLLDWELRLRAARYEARQPVNARLFCDDLLMGYRALFP
jgi:DNA polymerase-3 subunit delta'